MSLRSHFWPALLATSLCAVLAASSARADLVGANPERGWFFFQQPPKAASAPRVAAPPPKPVASSSAPTDSCAEEATWKPSCGFVNPGTNFSFQSKERDALLQRMVVSNNDPKAVEDFQRYMHWVLQRTAQVTNLWWYNMVQHPELDPTVAQPVSELGLRLMSEVQTGQESSIFRLVKESGGTYVVFSKDSCLYCHRMVPLYVRLSKATGIPVKDASIEGKCLEEMTQGCVSSKVAVLAAQALQVRIVPSIFLYVRPNTWIRLGTGVDSMEALQARTVQFFSAYRNALLKGVQNGKSLGQASVDFSGEAADGNGTLPVAGATGPVPSKAAISKMLGM